MLLAIPPTRYRRAQRKAIDLHEPGVGTCIGVSKVPRVLRGIIAPLYLGQRLLALRENSYGGWMSHKRRGTKGPFWPKAVT